MGFFRHREHADGGWAYSAHVPSDADSTGWALALAERLGASRTGAARPRGRVHTKRARIRRRHDVPARRGNSSYVRGGPSPDFSGWTQAHACVTAAAAQCDWLRTDLVDDLLSAQRSDGCWTSYWWFEDAYATALASAALARVDAHASSEPLKRAIAWATRRLNKEPAASPFALSLLLSILRHGDDVAQHRQRTAKSLAELQSSDGCWRGTAKLRIPSPEVRYPDSIACWERWWGGGMPFNIYSLDHTRVHDRYGVCGPSDARSQFCSKCGTALKRAPSRGAPRSSPSFG